MEDLLLSYRAEVPFRGYGNWVAMLCPFHDDRSPSASVNLMEDAFVCHTCGIRGDIVSVVQQVENVTVAEAKAYIEATLLDE